MMHVHHSWRGPVPARRLLLPSSDRPRQIHGPQPVAVDCQIGADGTVSPGAFQLEGVK
jgi:hypothetical protein